ncbi:hypothetical protein RND71_021514 [Anisodus tanguticus]|uniref:Legume lectin domain-containing protein n=1 Tax=Anisodus tanguticus TaxID=243964 RepID=A0AAE1RWC2_9SOLA|nr:hypothetical protein RND71_021514 [Anisodus tanguticus]
MRQGQIPQHAEFLRACGELNPRCPMPERFIAPRLCHWTMPRRTSLILLYVMPYSETQDQSHAFYPNPIYFKNSPNGTAFSFSTTFVFAIRSDYRPLDGHGLVFVIAPQRGIRGALSNHYLGRFNSTNNGKSSNHVVGVQFDTIYSEDFDDSDNNHVGIYINGLKSVAVHTAGYFDGTVLFHKKWSLRETGKLLSCDQEVIGSSRGNSLLQ